MSFKTRVSVLLLSTPVLAFVLIGGLLGNNAAARTPGDDKFQSLRVFEDVVSLVMQTYVEEVKVGAVMEGAMRGLADGLDPDSAYLTAAQVKQSQTPLPAGDVGIELTRQFYLRVIAARDDSPAARAGLQTGDYVRAIDGKATRDLTVFEGTRLLRGAPGSKVVLTVIRGNAAEPHEVTLVREKVSAPSVTSKVLDGGVGYVRVPAFSASTAGDLKRITGELEKSGAKALVIDVRRTAEGNIEDGIAAARLFVKSGTLSIRAGRNGGNKETIEAGAADGAITLPVQLLVTGGTSGPAELFATALRDNKRAELIGEHTLGRAGLQKLVKLPEGRGLWLTYAQYYRSAANLESQERKPTSSASSTPDIGTGSRPNAPKIPGAEAIHGKGLQPDVPVEDAEVTEFGAARSLDDPILDAALDRLRKKAA
ncbi:MAG: PDZ domain-containing protein [Acidobacteria bacterium]|nr:PDZ domain-containing protein [Acidobacteriota bacterium]